MTRLRDERMPQLPPAPRDKTEPQCLRCQASGRQCVPALSRAQVEGVSFRHGQNPSLRARGPRRYGESDLNFPEDQVWVGAPPTFLFEDETARIATDYRVVASPSLSTLPPHANDMFGYNQADSLPPADSLVEGQKLGHFNEAFLLRHFRKALAPWLDVHNADAHFSADVVERAPSRPLLLNACLAVSARHLFHKTGSVGPDAADGYHEQCIAILLPVLESRGVEVSFDVLLAATVTLRFFEQLSSHTPSSDLQRHLLAGSVYVNAHADCPLAAGLAEASFWVFVLQDVQSALAHRSPLRLTFRLFDGNLHSLWEAEHAPSERSWIHRAIWILAETIALCYGGPRVEAEGEEERADLDPDRVKDRIRAWESSMPASLRPLYFSPSDLAAGRPFPVVWFTSPSHASEWIRDPLARTCLLDLLHRTETATGWPWGYVIGKLGRDWGLGPGVG
ncbi:hypothetical protein PHISP_02844 [Aspergillus sp. HF37]|nr:hypothetical protein PHISP_02844 [Aspergillus sp. HF37]